MCNNKTVSIFTLGCRVNLYESCAISELLTERGFSVSKKGSSDYYIVNTCAVTAESERKSRQLVRRCAAKGKTLVIGCASQLEQTYAEIENVIYVGGNRNKTDVVSVICDESSKPKNSVSNMQGAPYEIMELHGRDELFSECRAFLKIEDGCNGKCTYCIIPKCRGNVRSRPFEDVISEAKRLVANGYEEIILTGIEVGAYNKAPLSVVIKSLSDIDGLRRVRLGSLSPNVISEAFLMSASESSNFMPHIHLSLQSCCDATLSRMLRPYRKKDIFDRVEAIRRYIPDCMISADIIVGFPGETEEDFLETLDALMALEIFHVHSFPYSERKGTPAAEMSGSVPKFVRSERNARLIASCAKTRSSLLERMKGKRVSVLIEKIVDGMAVGHSGEFIECMFESAECAVGDIVEVTVDSHDGEKLVCSLI